jgi:hypothetical protein
VTGRQVSTLVAICAALGVGCASSYAPREPGRIHIVGTAEGHALEKDGRLYGMSGLSSDPVEAVSGNPVAEEHARTFVSRTRTSTALILLGIAGGCAGGALNTTEPGHLGQKIAARGTLIAAGVTVIVSLLALLPARHHLYDAINIYNDDVPQSGESGLPILGRDTLRPRLGALAGSASKQDRD